MLLCAHLLAHLLLGCHLLAHLLLLLLGVAYRWLRECPGFDRVHRLLVGLLHLLFLEFLLLTWVFLKDRVQIMLVINHSLINQLRVSLSLINFVLCFLCSFVRVYFLLHYNQLA